MRDVTIEYTSTDNCPGGSCVLSVSSNEPVHASGSGKTEPDWIIVDDHLVQLRAERVGGGGGRVYTITLACTDAAGNVTTATTQVVVDEPIIPTKPSTPPKPKRK